MTRPRLFLLVALLSVPTSAIAQDEFKVEPLKSAVPDGFAAPIKAALAPEGVLVRNPAGEPFLEIWPRLGVPASGKPEGSKGAVQFPVLAEGELLGAIRYVTEGYDYRDQAISPGLYTIRYGLQPINGDHLGVSTYRDYALLVPAAKDASLDRLEESKLEKRSAEAAGTSHPGVLMMLAPPSGAKPSPSVAHDEEKNLWGAILGLPLAVPGEAAPSSLPVQIVIDGAAM